MLRLRWILPPLAALSLGGVLWMTLRGREVSPAELLDSARVHLAGKQKDLTGAQRDLDEALKLLERADPADAETKALLAEVLTQRAQVYRTRGLPDLALYDCQRRLASSGPEVETLALACEIALWLDDPGAALEYGTALAALDGDRAQGYLGRARVALADEPLAELERLARSELAPEDAAAALQLAQRAAVFAAEPDVSRAALDELGGYFRLDADRRLASELVHQAAEHLEAARSAFVASLERGLTVDAVAGLQDLLLRGGAGREVVDLGLAALALTQLNAPMPILARTASTLVSLGRDERARALVRELGKREKTVLDPRALPSNALRDELQEWCTLLERLGLWSELRVGAGELLVRSARNKENELVARFWLGLANLREKKHKEAEAFLSAVSAAPPRAHDIHVRVWLALGELARVARQPAQERYCLLLATKEAPLEPEGELRRAVGEAWLRLGTLQEEQGEGAEAEVSLTHALRFSPERAEEIEPRWRERGRKGLGSRVTTGVFAYVARAENELAQEEFGPALEDAEAVLAKFPGLGPALEVASKAAYRVGDYPTAISASLELIERGWPRLEASARLRQVPDEAFLPADRVRWMKLDPLASLPEVLDSLLARGERGAALAAVRGATLRSQPPELIVRAARLLLEEGSPAEAHGALAQLADGSPALRGAAALVVRAGLEAGEQPLSTAIERVLESGAPVDPELPGALDLLLEAGRAQECEALCEWLLTQPGPQLGPVLLRSAARRLIARTNTVVDEDLERASALLEPGPADLGRLLIAFDRGDQGEVAREAGFLLSTALAADPAAKALLFLLEDEPERAADSLGRSPCDGRSPRRELAAACLSAVRARAGETEPLPGIDGGAPFELPTLSPGLAALPPGTLEVTLLASDVAPWSAWALARLAEWPEATRAEPWACVLAAGARRALGDGPGAARALEPALASAPGLAAAWWLRAELARALPGSPQARARAAEPFEIGWLTASGSAERDEPALVPLQVATLLASDQRDAAVRILERELERTPLDPDDLAALARLESVDGRRTRAIQLYGKLFSSHPAPVGADALLDYLEVLRAARAAGEISEARWWSEVEALEAERPADPAPVRELFTRAFESPAVARITTSGDEEESGATPVVAPAADEASGVDRSRAAERLQRFRNRTGGRPIEVLRAGETRRWTSALERYTPERAVRFARAERLADPADPDVWRACAEAELAAERWSEALETLEALQRVAPAGDTARLYALTSYQLREDPDELARKLDEVARLDPAAGEDVVLAFYRSIAVLRGRLTGYAAIANAAPELWNARLQAGPVEPSEVRAFALALFAADKRGTGVRVLLQSLEDSSDSALGQDVTRALAYLMRAAPEGARLPAVELSAAGKAAAAQAAGAKGGGKAAALKKLGAEAPTDAAERAALKKAKIEELKAKKKAKGQGK